MEAEEALALAHFQGEHNLLRRLNALKRADFSATAAQIRCPVLIICSRDDLLVPGPVRKRCTTRYPIVKSG
jgi:aminoacrylate hydrolase